MCHCYAAAEVTWTVTVARVSWLKWINLQAGRPSQICDDRSLLLCATEYVLCTVLYHQPRK